MYLVHADHDKKNVTGIERALLWDFPKDSIQVRNRIRQLQELELELRYCRTRFRDLYQRLKQAKIRLINEYERKIDRIWNDQKCGTKWRNGQQFEPHELVIIENVVTWDGLTTFTELISQEANDRPDYIAMGTGTAEPSFGDQVMDAEIARIDIKFDGDISSDGTQIKWSGAFPTGIPNNTVSEFAAFDAASLGRMTYHVVIEDVNERLGHIQNRTIVETSHAVELNSVKNTLT